MKPKTSIIKDGFKFKKKFDKYDKAPSITVRFWAS
jgi:hypothetical protein